MHWICMEGFLKSIAMVREGLQSWSWTIYRIDCSGWTIPWHFLDNNRGRSCFWAPAKTNFFEGGSGAWAARRWPSSYRERSGRRIQSLCRFLPRASNNQYFRGQEVKRSWRSGSSISEEKKFPSLSLFNKQNLVGDPLTWQPMMFPFLILS